MALVSSGALSLQDIATEYGGSAPHALTEYYDKGNAPASGEIQMGADFHGTSNALTFTVTGTNVDFDLATYMTANSLTALPVINVTFNGTFGGSNASDPRNKAPAAITIIGFASGTEFNIINTGTIKGGSGQGAEGYCNYRQGGHGGNGITIDGNYTVSINNGSGTIYGAGGGGGGNSNGGSYGLCKYGGNGEGYARGSSGGAGGSHGGNGGQSGGSYGNNGNQYDSTTNRGGFAGSYVEALNSASVSFSSLGTVLGTAP